MSTKTKLHVHHVPLTWGEMLEAASKPPAEGAFTTSSTEGRESWTLTKTYEEAVSLATKGWVEGAAKAASLSEQFTTSVSAYIERMDPVNDIIGVALDIGSYVAGVPDAWVAWETTKHEGTAGRFTRILFDATASAGIDAGTMVKRGAAIAALAQCLELAGNRVQIDTLINTGGPSCGGYQYVAEIRVKDYDQPLDLERAAFALAHPSMLRRIGFRLIEQAPEAYRKALGYGYGAVTKVPANLYDPAGTIVIGGAMLGEPAWENEKATERWIIDTLKAQGVTVNEP